MANGEGRLELHEPPPCKHAHEAGTTIDNIIISQQVCVDQR